MSGPEAPPEPNASPITEELIIIGYNADGVLAYGLRSGLNPAAAVIMLEQIRQTMVGQFRFQRERKIDLVPGGALAALNGARKG